MSTIKLSPLILITALTCNKTYNTGNMQNPNKTNQLANEHSLYLKQHADNPVNWYPWSKEAFEKAKQENKPVLISIGYSSCHWCHVMEKESFMDTTIAKFMNEHFICIKVDREEHPEVDAFYMKAVQILTGHGGWPLNVFCTPEGDPFYGGTYFPPEPRLGMPSWLDILKRIAYLWETREQELREQARKLKELILKEDQLIIKQTLNNPQSKQVKELLSLSTSKIMNNYDKKYGGFSSAPKFPMFPLLDFLLKYGYITNNNELISASIHTLKNMLQGGIYDQLEGGICRYSTDAHWHVPHFEKMLYDNAQLIAILSDAYRITGDSLFLHYLNLTLNFIRTWLKSPSGGYYSAVDADSEGEEGKYYIWSWNEWQSVLKDNAELLAEYFGVTRSGNWHNGKNILHIKSTPQELSSKFHIPYEQVKSIILEGTEILKKYRSQRPKPSIDKKILLSWNALLLYALSKANAIARVPEIHQLYNFITSTFIKKTNHTTKIYRVFYEPNILKEEATSADLAILIYSLTHYYMATGKEKALLLADSLTQLTIKNFYEPNRNLFTLGNINSPEPYDQQVELYDHPFPSPNSLMAYNLRVLYSFTLKDNYATIYQKLISKMLKTASDHPLDYPAWLTAAIPLAFPLKELVITHPDPYLQQINSIYLPNTIIAIASPSSKLPLCLNKYSNLPMFYVCQLGVCHKPVNSLPEALKLLSKTE